MRASVLALSGIRGDWKGGCAAPNIRGKLARSGEIRCGKPTRLEGFAFLLAYARFVAVDRSYLLVDSAAVFC